MKLIFLLPFFLLTIVLDLAGQDTALHINSKWSFLKTQFLNRSNVIVKLTKALSKSKVGKIQITKLKNSNNNLSLLFKTLDSPDSISISSIIEMDNELDRTLRKILGSIEQDEAFKSSFVSLQMMLEESWQQIFSAVRDYNEICWKYKKTNLLFPFINHNKPTEG
jgi:hypothetical protein